MVSKVTTPASQSSTEVYKNIKNYSLQGLSLIIQSNNGTESIWLAPRESIRLPESQISQQMRNLHTRRLIQISN